MSRIAAFERLSVCGLSLTDSNRNVIHHVCCYVLAVFWKALYCMPALLAEHKIDKWRAMAEGGASGPPDLISGMVQPVDLVNSVTR